MARETILTEQTLEFAVQSDGITYQATITDNPPVLVEGETYTVVWNETEYNDLIASNENGVIVLTTDDFNMTYASAEVMEVEIFIITTFDISATHAITIYHGVQDGIVIRNPHGDSVTYGEYKKILINRASGAKTIYSEGEAVEGSIELDFSKGDMTVKPDNGKFWSGISIAVPEGLKSENIKYGERVAGIDGLYDNGIKDVSTEEEMTALLVAENVGRVYRFTGADTNTYTNGDLYEVEEAEV